MGRKKGKDAMAATRNEEVTGGRQVVPVRPFDFGTAENFVITWANKTFGVMNGVPFSTEPLWRRNGEGTWLGAEILFMQTMLERLTRYAEALATQPPDPADDEDKPVINVGDIEPSV